MAMRLMAGVDAGGTRVTSVLAADDGSVLLSHNATTPRRSGEAVVDRGVVGVSDLPGRDLGAPLLALEAAA